MVKNLLLMSTILGMFSTHSLGMEEDRPLCTIKIEIRGVKLPELRVEPGSSLSQGTVSVEDNKSASQGTQGNLATEIAVPIEPEMNTAGTLSNMDKAQMNLGAGLPEVVGDLEKINAVLGGADSDTIEKRLQALSMALSPGEAPLFDKAQEVQGSILTHPSGNSILEDLEWLNGQIISRSPRGFVLEESLRNVTEKIISRADSTGVLLSDLELLCHQMGPEEFWERVSLSEGIDYLRQIVTHMPKKNLLHELADLKKELTERSHEKPSLKGNIQKLKDRLYPNPLRAISDEVGEPKLQIILERIFVEPLARDIFIKIINEVDPGTFDVNELWYILKGTTRQSVSKEHLHELMVKVRDNEMVRGQLNDLIDYPYNISPVSLSEMIGDPSGRRETTGLASLIKNDEGFPLGNNVNNTGYDAREFDEAQTEVDQMHAFINYFNQTSGAGSNGIFIPEPEVGKEYRTLRDILAAGRRI